MRKLALISLAAAIGLYAACKTGNDAANVKAATDAPAAEPNPNGNRSATGGLTGSSDAGKTFRIKGDYPDTNTFYTARPPRPDMQRLRLGASNPAAVAAGREWMAAIQAYIYDDMVSNEFKLTPRPSEPSAYRPSNARWYHMPWLHTPNATPQKPGRGRDGLWGLTREADFKGPVTKWPKVAGQTALATDWGIGFYNEPGGYAIGQVFPADSAPNPKFDAGNGRTFPIDTVSFKILFTTAESIPAPDGSNLIEGAYKTTALINGGGDLAASNGPRQPTRVAHIQMDVDMRFGDGPEDWIFGTWVYDKSAKDDATLWQGMRPLGVQFGTKLAESIIFSDKFESNGFRTAGEPYSRLNGPADNPMSSCFACHARAQWPEANNKQLPFAPRDYQDKAMACLLHEWGGEQACGIPCGPTGCIPAGAAPVVPGSVGLDYSLQLALALRNQQIATKGR